MNTLLCRWFLSVSKVVEQLTEVIQRTMELDGDGKKGLKERMIGVIPF